MNSLSYHAGLSKAVQSTIPLLALLLLGGCVGEPSSLLNPGGPIAAAEKAHMIRIAAITLIAVVPVFVMVPLLLWRYRYKGKARYSPDWEFSGLLDVILWGVPIIITIVLSAQLWRNTKALDPYRAIEAAAPPLALQVVALDWKWLFVYPELGIASLGEMAIPTNRPITLSLTSDTVMQSFMIGALAGQIYVMPGMRTELNLLADIAGVYEGENTQFNGKGFAKQKFEAVAMTDTEFEDWVAKTRTIGIALDDKSYRTIARPSTTAEARIALGTDAMLPGVVLFGSVPSTLFSDVMHRYHTGKSLARSDQPGTTTWDDASPLAPTHEEMQR